VHNPISIQPRLPRLPKPLRLSYRAFSIRCLRHLTSTAQGGSSLAQLRLWSDQVAHASHQKPSTFNEGSKSPLPEPVIPNLSPLYIASQYSFTDSYHHPPVFVKAVAKDVRWRNRHLNKFEINMTDSRRWLGQERRSIRECSSQLVVLNSFIH
jgi:hypothetical protein